MNQIKKIRTQSNLAEWEDWLEEERLQKRRNYLPERMAEKVEGLLKIIKIDPEDAVMVNRCVNIDKGGYARASFHSKIVGHKLNVLIHRAILRRMVGREISRNEHCDHINGDRLDNRRSNLRLCSCSDNSRNRHVASRASKLGVIGVGIRRGKFRASLKMPGSTKMLINKSFNTLKEAVEAFNHAAERAGFLTRSFIPNTYSAQQAIERSNR